MEKTLSRKLLFDGRALKLWLDTVEMSDGRQTTREIVEHRECVTMVPVDSDGNILLIRQYRQAIGKEILELPAGCIDEGENPETAVIREMREETGFKPRMVERMGGFYSSPGFCTEYLYLFLARDLTPSPLTAEDTPEIRVIPTSPENIPGLIASGEIQDSKSIAGLLSYLYIKK